jgi:hypothetical protein
MSYRHPSPPGPGTLFLAGIFPACVIALELATGMCRAVFFDPMPGVGHLLLVAFVPACNVMLWRAARRGATPARLVVAGGAAMCIAASYALLFLPMLPIALVALLLGVGALPFAPLTALVMATRWTVAAAADRPGGARLMTGGVVLGAVALLAVDLPATMTQVALDRYAGDPADRASAVRLMRVAGDRGLLLRQSYGDSGRAGGIGSFLASVWTNGAFFTERPRTAEARELYYRVTGQAFNAVPRPGRTLSGAGARLAWDDDQGADEVGGRVPDLTLTGSRIDGVADDAAGFAYLEWTIDLTNRGDAQREGRFTIALPEGAVASRATLWVNGEPREASIAGRGEARAAYSAVVSTSRDPLLVTTDGAQRLLVQVFPVQPHARVRLRIGVTAPFAVAADGTRTLAPPAMVERNFDLAPSLHHALWVEGAARPRATLADATLTAGGYRIALPPVTAPSVATGLAPAQGKAPALAVAQRTARVAAPAGPLMLVVDASADMAATGAALPGALEAVAPGRPVGLVVAGEAVVTVAPQPWGPAQANRIRAALAATRFAGGQDDRAALATALQSMPRADATLLWLHGSQPVRFAEPEPALEQALDRLPARPRLVRYQAVPGRALVPADSAWFDTARFVSPATDLRTVLADVAGGAPRWAVTRTPRAVEGAAGSVQLVRLWAAGELAAGTARHGRARIRDVALAHRLNIVTPVSGAVVLETNRDYGANGLPVPDPDAVPTLPEPETWALLILTIVAGGWMIRRRARPSGVAA